ncbi:MAG TPA: hypothetical protein VJL29_14115, partial [Thermoguttaceae bacterium]|nr:hypothetical protein [Thermoguttaceae bacterium]
ITFFAVSLSEPAREAIRGTQSGRYIAVLVKRATPVLPEEVTKVVGGYLDELDQKLDPNAPLASPGKDLVPGFDGSGFGNEVLGDVKQGLDKSGGRAKEGLEKRLDQLEKDLKGAVDQARSRAQNELNNLPKQGGGEVEKAEDPKQGRGGGSWW